MKKIISILLIFTLCFSALPFSAFAQNTVNYYTDDEKEFIYLKYTSNEHMLDALFNSDKAIAYWSMVNDIEENGFLKWAIEKASKIIGEYPDEQDYAEILANLVMMQSGDIAEQVQNQSQYDNLKDGVDYAMDIVGIASDFVGGSHLLETISPIIDAATGGAEVIVDNVEQAKYYETSIRDYSQTKLFLDAVAQYADNDELNDVAKSLLRANDTLLEKRLEYLSGVAGSLAEYEAKFFVENMSFALLKTADLYASDETVKWYVDCGEKLGDSISSIFAAGKFAFNMTMLAGDIGFGTSDTFNRYQEMKIVSDVAGAIVKANSKITVPQDADYVLSDIRTKCNYYKMLISTHARGEYLVYQLLVNDAGLLSDFRVLFDYFKEPGETTDSWYARQIDCMTYYYDLIERIFEVSDVDVPHGLYDDIEITEPIRTTSNERDIVLVLDVSGSMSGTPMEETKKASVNFIDTILDEDASIGIVTYDNSASMLSDFSVDETALTTAASSIYDGGGTNIESGLAQARSMLNTSNAKKKIIVLMSDGEPNDGKEGDDLIAYADDIKDDGIIIYTLGFFESMGSYKSSAQILMEGIASDGCHYEVASADDLVFFFEDVADQINGQKYIYIRIACPVDVTVTHKGETLCSAEDDLNTRTDFGTLTFEDNENVTNADEDDRIKVLRLKEGADYDIQITGTGHGLMDYTIGFMDENGDYSDFRRFEDVKITRRTTIDTVAAVSKTSVLNIDENGDGKYDLKLRAEENGYGEEVDDSLMVYTAISGGAFLFLVIVILIARKNRKKRKVKENY